MRPIRADRPTETISLYWKTKSNLDDVLAEQHPDLDVERAGDPHHVLSRERREAL